MAKRSRLDEADAQAVIIPALERNPKVSSRELQTLLAGGGIELSHTAINNWLKKRRGTAQEAVKRRLNTTDELDALTGAGEILGASLKQDLEWIDERLRRLDGLVENIKGTEHKTTEELLCKLTDTQRRLIEQRFKLMRLTPAPDVVELASKVGKALEKLLRWLPDELREQARAKIEAELEQQGVLDLAGPPPPPES
jgi:hypothetical protein